MQVPQRIEESAGIFAGDCRQSLEPAQASFVPDMSREQQQRLLRLRAMVGTPSGQPGRAIRSATYRAAASAKVRDPFPTPGGSTRMVAAEALYRRDKAAIARESARQRELGQAGHTLGASIAPAAQPAGRASWRWPSSRISMSSKLCPSRHNPAPSR